MMEHKRSPVSVEQGSLSSLTPKRHKSDLSISSKERKEKVGERIAALQQLVSPYGKTDTASVLLEAMEYINFLHEQVKVLSAPYLHCASTTQFQVRNFEHRIRFIQLEKQRLVSGANFLHHGSCEQQWSRYLGPNQDQFSEILKE